MRTGEEQDLAARIDGLEAELAAARARGDERGALSARETELAAEIAAVQARIVARGGRKPSLLDEVRIASPCSVSWDDMEGDDRVRHCKACDRSVFYLSAMTTLEAERLLAEHESPCLRLWQRADGTLITADCPVGRRRVRVRNVIAAAGSAAVIAALAILQGEPTPGVRAAERGLGRLRRVADRAAAAVPPPPRAIVHGGPVYNTIYWKQRESKRKPPPPPVRGDKST